MMGSTRCPACGQAIGTGSPFCPACGAQLSSAQSYGSPGTLSRMVPLFSGNGYTIEQKILALRDTFGIKDRGGNQLAYVKKQLVSFGPKFWYESTNGEKLGEIHGKVLAIRPTFEIYNSQGQLVAQVKKKILKLIGEAWWMENSSGQEIAQIHKKWVSVRDSYNVEILNPAMDPYLVLSYAISLDNTEKREKH